MHRSRSILGVHDSLCALGFLMKSGPEFMSVGITASVICKQNPKAAKINENVRYS